MRQRRFNQDRAHYRSCPRRSLCVFARNTRQPTEIYKPVENRGARSIPSGHITGGRACLEIAGASKRPERGKSLTHAGRPVHFTTMARWKRQGLLTIATAQDAVADMQGVQTTGSAEPEASPQDPFTELPLPVTPLEAKRVGEEQRRPRARSVAKALTGAGRPVHFTTVASWEKREWQVEARLEHQLAAAMRKIDLFVPLLTGDPATKAVDIVGDIVGARAGNRQSMSENQGPDQV